MASNKDTIESMEANSLDAMFGFTVAVGITMFLLAWTTVCLAVKGIAQGKDVARREGNEFE